jgi:hypoxanthine phosphoribosyltransferase
MWSVALGITTLVDLARSVDRSGFMPDYILAISERGAMVGNLVARELRKQIPIVTVAYLDKHEATSIPGYITLEGTKATTFVPAGLKALNTSKILLLDDFVMSGDGLERVRNWLLADGFANDNIRSGAVVTTRLAIANHKGPDFYAKETKDFDFWFPWGRAK